ncbi:hypothetical protein [Streptomyces sp. cg40]|uniref:hypothetical protein n=1 Tax=Streptomyces sp. cg40 TaxID=3419764 RepID=UPI003D07A2C1
MGLGAVGRALVSIARDQVSVPSRIAASTPAGPPGAESVTVSADPRHSGRGFHRGLVALFDEHDGRASAFVDGESLTGVRTAAVATRSAPAPAAGPGPRVVADVRHHQCLRRPSIAPP